jgi:hypothetical protein
MNWIYLAQDKDQWTARVSMVMNVHVPYDIGNVLSRWVTGSFSRRSRPHVVSGQVRTIAASCCSSLGLITGQIAWDLWWTK